MTQVRHLFLPFVLFLALAGVASATPESPEKTLEGVSERILQVLKAEREVIDREPGRMFELVDQVLGPHVDFPLIARLVLGKYWRGASEQQKERFISEFRLLLVRFYVAALLDDPKQLDELLAHSENLIRFLPTRLESDADRVRVRSEVNLPSGQMVPVSFNLYRRSSDWKVYDVNVEGISLVTNYRNSFTTEVARDGLDRLIERLAERNRTLLLEKAVIKAE